MACRTESHPITFQSAVWLTALIRLCQISVNSGDEVLTRLAFWVQAGHDHSGMDSIAMEGASSVKVPPWRMGSLGNQEQAK